MYHAYVYSKLQKYGLAVHFQIYWTILNEKSEITFFDFWFNQPLATILYLFKIKLYLCSFQDIFKKCNAQNQVFYKTQLKKTLIYVI